MTNSTRGFFGSLLTFILGIIVGIVLLVGGIAGGAYWAYNNLEMKKVNELANMNIVGEDYQNSTVKEFMDQIIGMGKDKSQLTLGNLEKLFSIVEEKLTGKYPDGIIPLKLQDTQLGEIDINVLREIAFDQLGSEFNSILNISATLDALSALEINLPNIPFIQGSEENPVYFYTLATEEETPFTIQKNYSNYTEYYTLTTTDEYTAVTDVTGLTEYYILDGTSYILACNDLGEILPEYNTYTEFYTKSQTEVYTLYETTDVGTKQLYVKTNGIKSLPMIDALNNLSSMLDFEKLTLRDLESKFGINFKENGEYNSIIETLLDIPINQFGSQINDKIQEVELTSIIESGDNQILNAILYQEDGTTPVKVGEISDRIDTLKLGDVIEIDATSSPILISLQNSTLNNLSQDIDALTLEEIMTIDSSSPQVLQALKQSTLSTLSSNIDAMTMENLIGIDTSSPMILQAIMNSTLDSLSGDVNALTLGQVIIIDSSSPKILQSLASTKINALSTKINALYLNEMIDIDSTSPLTLQALSGSTLESISTDINNLYIEEIIAITSTSSSFLKALEGTKINDIDTRLSDLTLQEIFAEDIYDGYDGVKASGATLDYATYGFKKFYTLSGGVYTEVTGVFNQDETFNNDYLNTELYSDKVADGMWKFFVEDDGVEQNVVILELGTRMDNIATNIRESTLYELKTNGLITTADSTLNTEIRTGLTIGDCTMEQLIDEMVTIMNMIP